ncbi:MAG TPA: glycoside hydrolase family 28 protein [Streptosporangiaceae bacterium]|nr:glycoside hydrolase family 28 protein [Streptosporangiaceae bacterium]
MTDAPRERWTRRRALGVGGAVLGGGLAASLWPAPAQAAPGAVHQGGGPWAYADQVKRRVRAPRFPRHEAKITDFGAVGDGTTDCSRAFAAAIAALARRGGGRVIVPPGRFLTGPIRLRSRIDLHVSESATIAFSTDPAAYLPVVFTRWEGVELLNYSPLIYAFGARDIAITGAGTLDGQGSLDDWWPWKGQEEDGWEPGEPEQSADRTALMDMAEQGVPVSERVFGGGHFLRPNMIQPYRCRNVLIEGVTILNSPMWHIHPVLSQGVLIKDVTVIGHGPNNDGCNPESCTDVVITGCTFDTGDDCIAIKAGRNADGRRVNVPSQNIVVDDCDFRDGHGGLTMGSEMTGGISHVFGRNLRMSSPNLNTCLRFKTNSLRGGYIRDVYLRDTEVGVLAVSAFQIDFFYEEGPGRGFNPLVEGIHVENLHVDTARQVFDLRGYPDDPIRDVSLTHCSFDDVETVGRIVDVEGLVLTDVTVNGEPIGG